MTKKLETYGIKFDSTYDQAMIERHMLRNGGKWTRNGKKFGEGLFFHFKAYWSVLWPDDSQTRWTDSILNEILENQFVGIVGPGSSWKTSTVARIAMMDWSLFPDCTLVIMSSTNMEGLRSRVYGETSKMWGIAYRRFEWWPGHPIDHRCAIAYHDIDEDAVRDMRCGIIGIPNKTSDGKTQGVSNMVGKKNTRVWSIADELQFMDRSFLDAQNNLVNNGPNLLPGLKRDELGNPLKNSEGQVMPIRGYKAVFIGNPNPTRPENALHVVCEPDVGWAALPDDGKTKVWTAKQVPNSVIKARVINLDGADSPNNDFPGDTPHWPQLINKTTLSRYQKDSEAYWTQGRGVVKLGLAGMKVITIEICRQFKSFDAAVWNGSEKTTRIGYADIAYGGVGGDRCVCGHLEFGHCVDGVVRMMFHPLVIVPVTIREDMIPEDQIAVFIRRYMEQSNVPPEHFYFDGRGSMAISFARLWSPLVNTVEFGGTPTERIAGPDIFYTDKKTNMRRPKTAKEHYSKFVSELWWSWRYAVESDQVRGLSVDAVLDAAPREWFTLSGDKIDIETKRDMKKRTGCSPDLADSIAIGIEGARRRGFTIAKLGVVKNQEQKASYLQKLAAQHDSLLSSRKLQNA